MILQNCSVTHAAGDCTCQTCSHLETLGGGWFLCRVHRRQDVKQKEHCGKTQCFGCLFFCLFLVIISSARLKDLILSKLTSC